MPRLRSQYDLPELHGEDERQRMGGSEATALPTRTPGAASGAAHAPSAFEEAALSPERYGHDLFMEKGCVVCHAHASFTTEREVMGIGSNLFGPVLTSIKLDSVYLHRWLKDPAAIKGAGVQMPTLGLSDGEIDGLVIFLTTYKEK